MNNIDVKKELLRLCRVSEELGYFHGWEQYSYVVRPGLTVDSAPGGQISQIYGIVEFPNRIARVEPEAIAFVDDINADLCSMNKHYQEDLVRTKLKDIEEMLNKGASI